MERRVFLQYSPKDRFWRVILLWDDGYFEQKLMTRCGAWALAVFEGMQQ